MLLTPTQTETLYYNKTDTYNLLANKVSSIGDIELPGMLDIGTSGYTNSRIRCNAELDGYTGYAELWAASSYGMFLNPSTTRTDGGRMYFRINNDDYIQLSGSDNKANIYKYTTTSGNLNASVRILKDGSHSNVQPKSSTSSETLVLDQSMSSEFGSDSHCKNVYGRQGGNSHLKLYNSNSGSVCNILTDEISDVGTTQAQTPIKAYVNHAGHQGNVEIEAMWNTQGYINFNTAASDGLLLIATKDVLCMYCGINSVYLYKPTTNASDDRLKENRVIIEHACETLSKLRPQLYDKKPDMENNDPTTWYKESGLIAQETYYDAPELRHLVHQGKPDLDEEGNSIPLPEIPTSIDLKPDPDYSSWGKDPASGNYIGIIADLVNANTELHERVKALEG